MTRHPSAEQLASYAVGGLRRRKAAAVATHVTACTQCAHARQQLAELPTVLAASLYPPLPETVTVRIEAALRVEVNRRVSAAPASEAGRRDLPARRRRRPGSAVQRGWHLPGLSVRATRLAAAVTALALVGGGGYLIADSLSASVGTNSSSAAAPPPTASQPMTEGPSVTYGSAGSQHTIHTVSSSANFVPAELRSEAVGAVHEAELKGFAGTQSAGANSAPGALNSPSHSATAGGAQSRLAGCIDVIGPGRSVLLLELAKFEGKPATIIVFGHTATSPAEVVVAASSCSADAPGVLARAALGNL